MPDLKPTITQGDDGKLNYVFPPGVHAVLTGPISGEVTIADGTTYNVSAEAIGCPSLEHAQEVMHRIGLRHVAEGSHPSHTDDGGILLLPGETPPTREALGVADHERTPFCYTVPERFADEVFGPERTSHLAAHLAAVQSAPKEV